MTARPRRVHQHGPTPKTVSDLVLWDSTLTSEKLVTDAEQLFIEQPDLPACIISFEDTSLGILSKKSLNTALSKPFFRELFSRRSISKLVGFDVIEIMPLTLPLDTTITDATEQALSRSIDKSFDPILIAGNNRHQVLQVDDLLHAQSMVLEQAVHAKDGLLKQVQQKANELKVALAGLEKTRDELLKSEQHLETQVAERTLELATTNQQLTQKQKQIEEELKVAQSLQQSILPSNFPSHPQYQGHACMRSARMIGGDFYDVFPLDEFHLALVIADVSGKGVPAALFMVLVRTILQNLATSDLSPADCITKANQQINDRNPLSLFVTVIFGVLDIRTGLFTFCNGGHSMPYIIRTTGEIETVSARASPLVGLIETARYNNLTIKLESGDSLLLVTDGIVECFNSAGEAFGESKLLDTLADLSTYSTDKIIDKLLGEIDHFSAGTMPSDDLTILAMKYLSSDTRDESQNSYFGATDSVATEPYLLTSQTIRLR